MQKVTDREFIHDSNRPGRLNRQCRVTTVAGDAAAWLLGQRAYCRTTIANILHEADPLFTDGFKAILKPSDRPEGATCVKIPPRSPNCNPHAERFVGSIKFECLRHFAFFSERHFRYVIKRYMRHDHEERFHQGIGGQFIRPAFAHDNALTREAASCVDDEVSHCVGGDIKCRSRIEGLLNLYYREAA